MADRTSSFGEWIPPLALVLIGVIATFVLLTMPVLVAGMVTHLQLGDREIGWLASADMAGGALACALILPKVSRVNWRLTVRLAIAFAITGNLVSIYADSFESLMLVRFFTGFANGFALAIVFTGLCHSRNPDRFFGVYVFAQLSLQVVLLAILPRLMAISGMAGVFILLASASVVSLFLVAWIPDRFAQTYVQSDSQGPDRAEAARSHARVLGIWAIVALAAQGLYFLAPAATWGYLEPIGGSFSLDINQVGNALSMASVAGIIGAAVVVVLGAQFNRIRCMMLGTLMSLAAVFVWLFGSDYFSYLVAAALFSFAWNYTFPYQMGVLALFDRVGAVAVLSLIVQLVGLAFGPLLASLLLLGDGYDVILWACIVCYVASLALFVLANRHRPVVGVESAH